MRTGLTWTFGFPRGLVSVILPNETSLQQESKWLFKIRQNPEKDCYFYPDSAELLIRRRRRGVMDGYQGLGLLAGIGLFLGFMALILWWSISQERQKAELAHAERRRTLERGIPLPDAEVARCKALGWIGTAVPVASLGTAAGVTALLVPPRLPEPSIGGLVAVWTACGAAAVAGVVAAIVRLRTDSVRIASGVVPDDEPGAAADGGGTTAFPDP
jgi:hypothetical protein